MFKEEIKELLLLMFNLCDYNLKDLFKVVNHKSDAQPSTDTKKEDYKSANVTMQSSDELK